MLVTLIAMIFGFLCIGVFGGLLKQEGYDGLAVTIYVVGFIWCMYMLYLIAS